MEWISLEDKNPENDFLMVKDLEGRIAYAYPTYYPFKMVDGKVVHCDLYWDGNWLIRCNGVETPKIGKITHWKKPKTKPPIKLNQIT